MLHEGVHEEVAVCADADDHQAVVAAHEAGDAAVVVVVDVEAPLGAEAGEVEPVVELLNPDDSVLHAHQSLLSGVAVNITNNVESKIKGNVFLRLKIFLMFVMCLHCKTYILRKDPPPLCEHCQCILTVCHILVECNHFARERKDIFGRRDVVFNDALNTFYLRLYGVRHMVKDHSDSEKGNPLPPHRLLLSINSKGSFICTIPQTG